MRAALRSVLRGLDWLRHFLRLRRWRHGQAWGRRGEDLAHRFLQDRGYVIIARNFRTPSGDGEVDLIARDSDSIVFVEVKARASDAFGSPEEAVDSDKRQHLLRAAGYYLRRAGLPWEAGRFDIVSILLAPTARIEHIKDAFGRQKNGRG